MRKKSSGTPFVPPLPHTRTPESDADIADAIEYMEEEQRRRKTGFPGEWADNWLADYESTVDALRTRHAGAVRARTQKHVIDGEPMFRENFATSSGSPWVIWYRLEEDATGAAVRLIVRRVLHGRANTAA